MSAATFDPFDLERPRLRLGSHGEWELGDITDARRKKLEKLLGELQAWDEDAESSSIADAAKIVGKLCAVICIDGASIPALLVDLTKQKHGEDAIGAMKLRGIADFVRAHLAGELSVGEG